MDTFIVLFVIFILVFVVVQIALQGGGDEVSRVQQTERELGLQTALVDAKQHCDEVCNEVIANGCAERSMAEYCVERYGEHLDLNLNGVNDYDDTYFNGLGVCEDTIFCPQLTDCFCREKITLVSCAEVLCRYYQEEQDLDAESASVLVKNVLALGNCDAARTNWHAVLEESGRFTCRPILEGE